MGTWGSGILDDDFARDVYDRYMDAHGEGVNPESIVGMLLKDFTSLYRLEHDDRLRRRLESRSPSGIASRSTLMRASSARRS